MTRPSRFKKMGCNLGPIEWYFSHSQHILAKEAGYSKEIPFSFLFPFPGLLVDRSDNGYIARTNLYTVYFLYGTCL